MTSPIIKKLIEEKAKPLPGLKAHKKMMLHRYKDYDPNPPYGKESAVLINLYPDTNNQTNVIMIERTKVEGSAHSGQISFPGGKKEEDDNNLIETALREAKEEINLKSNDVHIIRALSPIYIPVSDFKVFPYLSYSEAPPSNLKACSIEVAQIIHFNMDMLLHNLVDTSVETFTITLDVKAYQLNGFTVWGASAMMLAEIAHLLNN